MNQYGVTEEEAKMELTKQIEAAWKDINQEWLHLLSSSIINPQAPPTDYSESCTIE